uniref:CUE domain-containing protein n=1 Tax=Caenorhabditis tropicalis TaxID=1561998 RepID=A0A1I7V277_9PELO
MPRASPNDDVASTSTEEPHDRSDSGVNRFLKQRKRRSSGNDSHNKRGAAHCPEYKEFDKDEDDDDDDEREIPLTLEPLTEFTQQDLARLKQAAPHLPDDSAVQILSFYNYNVDRAIKQAQQMVVPTLIPETHQKMIVANIAMEKDFNPTKKQPYKEFYLQNFMQKTVSSQTLVDFYYREKNKIGGNWRLEHDDPEETPESKAEFEEKLKTAGISFVTAPRGNSIPRAAPTRQSVRTRARRSEVERLQDIDMVQSPPATPSTSDGPSTSNGTSSQERIHLRFRFTPGSTNGRIITTPRGSDVPEVSRSAGPSKRPSGSIQETPKKRKSLGSSSKSENGIQRTYPMRDRKSTSD